MMTKIYPRTGDQQTVYLNAVIKDPQIEVGDYTIYNDFIADPLLFEKNNVLYHYPIHREKLIIGKFCSIACGTKFLFNCANHTLKSLSTYTFPLFYEEWELEKSNITTAWDNKGNIVIGIFYFIFCIAVKSFKATHCTGSKFLNFLRTRRNLFSCFIV